MEVDVVEVAVLVDVVVVDVTVDVVVVACASRSGGCTGDCRGSCGRGACRC